MYCMKCGCKLTQGQKHCPLCNTRMYHPDLPREEGLPTYPEKDFESEAFNPQGVLFVLTVFMFLCAALPMIFELMFFKAVNWSGYTVGAVVLAYLLFILPFWFRHRNPVIFVPCDFAGVLLYLLYIDLRSGGQWFLSFAFPVGAILALLVTALVALCRYCRRGQLYIFGGFFIALGGWTVLLQFFLWHTFDVGKVLSWSICSLVTFFLLGMMLIVIALVRPLRESLRKKFFM